MAPIGAKKWQCTYICIYVNTPFYLGQPIRKTVQCKNGLDGGFKSCCLLGLGRKVLGWWWGQVLPKWVCFSKLLHGKSLLWKNLHDVISLTYGVCRTFMVTFNQALHSWKLSPPSIRGVLLSLHAKVV